MTAQDLTWNLRAAGFDEHIIETYLSCWRAGETQEQMQLLTEKRNCLLDRVHQEEKRIEHLDYLVYRIRRECHQNRKDEKQ